MTQSMEPANAEHRLRVLFVDSLKTIESAGEPLSEYSGRLAFYNPVRDARVNTLASFSLAAVALSELPLIREQFGVAAAERVALQFVYNCLTRVEQLGDADLAFRETWDSLQTELAEPAWTHFGVANLQNFSSTADILDLRGGVTIRGRNLEELRQMLQWGDFAVQLLENDWQQGAAGSYIILSEYRIPKTPDNLIRSDLNTLWSQAERMLLALRLYKSGDISMGRMFYARPAHFRIGVGGMNSTGATLWRPGPEYCLEPADVPMVQALHEKIEHCYANNAARHTNIALALRRFESIYDRMTFQASDRLVDSITALEALFKVGSELSFRIAFRTAGLLAATDDERVAFFGTVSDFYETRNKIVHGSSLDEKHRAALQREQDLRDIVRRLLRGFLQLSEAQRLTKTFYAELESSLQHSAQRDQIRSLMGLE